MSEEVSLVVLDDAQAVGEIKLWSSYEFQSEFLTPTDGCRFSTGGTAAEMLELKRRLLPGTRCSLVVDGKVQATMLVASAPLVAKRSGSSFAVRGYDPLWPMVNSSLDPAFSLAEGTTLQDLVVRVATQFGFSKFSTTDIANRSIVTGNSRAHTSTTSASVSSTVSEFDQSTNKYVPRTVVSVHSVRYDPTKPKFLKDVTLKQMQPKPGEGAFQFLAKACRRFELWPWCSALGDELIVDTADFDQAPSMELYNDARGRVNYDHGEVVADGTNQPSVIIASGHGSTPTSQKAKLRVAMVNELTGLDSNGVPLPAVTEAIAKAVGCRVLDIRPALVQFSKGFRNSVARPMYVHDDDSKTFGQLESFVRHEMAARQSKGAGLRYVVPGHSQNGLVWAVNTVVRVDDDALDFHEPMWVRGRVLSKSRESPGTTTTLDLIRLGTLDLKA